MTNKYSNPDHDRYIALEIAARTEDVRRAQENYDNCPSKNTLSRLEETKLILTFVMTSKPVTEVA
jgi:hypothetical protein